MQDNLIVLKLKPKEIQVLKAVGELISQREEESNNNKKTSINANAVHLKTGIAFQTCKKYLKQLKEL